MKRLFVIFCTLAICAATFTACGRSDEQLLNEEAMYVYNIVKKYDIEKPVSSRYTYNFALDTENISETLGVDLVEELNEHFGDSKSDYKISIKLDSDGDLDGVMIWFRNEFDEAWARGDYDAKSVTCGEYSE